MQPRYTKLATRLAVAMVTLALVATGARAQVAAPTIAIVQPATGAVFALGAAVTLQAQATDAAGGDLGARVAWTSNVDGSLGTGPQVQTALSVGTHTIRASVTDGAGRSATAQAVVAVVVPANVGDTTPLVTITAPQAGDPIAAGAAMTFAGTASDLEDGTLSDGLVWSSDRDGALGTGATFSRALSQGIHRISAQVTDSAGVVGSASVVVQVGAPVTLAFAPVADGSVDAAQPATGFGTAPVLRVDADTARRAYLRFVVAGVGTREVRRAVLRLQVDAAAGAGSSNGGRVHIVAGGAWDESTLTWATQPSIDPAPLAVAGPVVRGQIVDFDVTPAVAGDGPCELALLTDSEDEVTYRSREGGPPPRLIVTVAGNPPVVTVDQPAPGAAVTAGTVLTLHGHAVDLEDGDLDAGIEWISSRDGLLGDGATVTTTALSVGTHTITASASDAQGAVGTAEVLVTVVAPADSPPPSTPRATNAAPVVAITAPAAGDVLLAGQPVVLGATAWDAEDGDLGASVRWVSSRDGVLGSGATLVVPALRAGTHMLTASVVDHAGVPASSTIMVSVTSDTLVFAATADTYVDAASPGTAFGGAAELSAGVTPASRLAFLRFAVSGLGRFTVRRATVRLTPAAASATGGTVVATSDTGWSEATTTYGTRPAIDGRALRSQGAVAADQPVDFDVTPAVAGDGTYGFALVSTDGDGVRYRSRESATGGPVLVVTLGQTSAPVVTIRSPAAGATVAGDTAVVFSAVATDGRGNDVGSRVRWTSSLSGVLGTGATITATRLAAGTHLVTAAVTDAQGQYGEARVAVVVQRVNQAPVVTILSPVAGSEIVPGTAVHLAAVVTDDGDRDIGTRLAWSSNHDGALGTGPSIAVVLSPGPHLLTASATDRSGRTGSAQVSIAVSVPPTIAITAPADGATALPGALVSLAASAFDQDDGDLSARIAWTSDLQGALGTGGILRLATLRAGRHTVTATVTDSSGLTVAASRTLVVNTPPTVSIAAPVPFWRFVPGDTVTLAAVARDAEDGDLGSRIVWSSDVDGPLGVGATIPVTTLSLATHTLTAAVADLTGIVARASVTLAPFGCLAQAGPLVPLSGLFASPYINTQVVPSTRIDARAATFVASAANRYPLNLHGGPGVCVGGGVVLGQYDRTLSWSQMHFDNNNAAIAFDDATLTVDGLRLDNVTDGIRPQAGDGFVVRGTRMSYVRDDCIENDHLLGGLVDDSLLDGCYVAFSARPSQAIIDSGFDGRGKVWTIQGSLVRLQPMPGPDGTSADGLGNGGFFKWHLWGDATNSLSPKLALHDNVFMAERVGMVGADRMGIPPNELDSCSNNVMVWLGPGDYPAALPSCFTVTKDRGVWDRAVADWERRHPQVK